MLALARQVQIASDAAKGCVARLAGVDVPSFADTETTFPELQARIAKTVDFVKGFKAAQIDGSEERNVHPEGPRRGDEVPRPGLSVQAVAAELLFSTSPPPTTSCATTAWNSARWIIWDGRSQ